MEQVSKIDADIDMVISYPIYFLARSPVYTHISATLNGLSTIRAFSAQKILIEEFDK